MKKFEFIEVPLNRMEGAYQLMYSPTNPPAIIDIEASGFGRGSYPIEIGYILADGQSHCSLIHPLPHWVHWDHDAEKLHQISPQTLACHGKPVWQVATTLNQNLNGLVLYSDGWINDYSWLSLLFEEVELTPTFRLEDLRQTLTPEDEKHWHVTKARIQEETSAYRHRASSDARVIQQTWLQLHSTR